MRPSESFREVWVRLQRKGAAGPIDTPEFQTIFRRWLDANAPRSIEGWLHNALRLAEEERTHGDPNPEGGGSDDAA
jgi:hypothetical protein